MAKKEDKKSKVLNHELVPKHEIMDDGEIKELLKKYNIKVKQLPRILSKDPAIKAIGAKEGDIIKITRASPTAGKTVYYRLVKEGRMRKR